MASFLYTATAIGGGPESGALCYVFTRGTTTPAVSYSDSGLTTPTLNPIVADADGRIAPAYFDDSLDLTFRVKTADRATNLLRVDFRDGVFSVTYAQIDQLTLFEEDDTSDGAQTHVLTDCVVDNPWGVRILFDGIEQPVANYSVVTDGTDTTVTYATNCQPATGVRVLYKSAVLQALSPAAIDYSAIDISAAKVTPTAATEDSLANWLAAKVTASGGDASATVVTATGAPTAATLADRSAREFWVEDFAAVAGDTSGAAAEINAAITAANAAGGGIVHLGRGTFTVEAVSAGLGVSLKSNVHLKGSGVGATILKLKDAAEAHTVQVSGLSNVSITDLSIDGNRDNQVSTDLHGIRLGGTALTNQNITIERVEVYETAHYGIGIQGGTNKDITIRAVEIHDTGADGLDVKNIEDANENVVIDDVSVRRWGLAVGSVQAAIDTRGTVNISNVRIMEPNNDDVVGIRFREGELLDVNGLGAHRSTLTGFYVDMLTKTGAQGIYVAARDVTVSNGYVRGGQDGVAILDSTFRGASITVEACSDDGFYLQAAGSGLDGDGAILTGCAARSCTDNGFRIDTDNVQLIGCEGTGNDEGVLIAAGADSTRIIGGRYSGNSTAQISDLGTNTRIRDAVGVDDKLPNQWRLIAQSSVAASHTGNTSKTAVATVSIPAGAMGPNGRLKITSHWTMPGSTNSKTTSYELGGTAFFSVATTNAGTLGIRETRDICNVNNSSVQKCVRSSSAIGWSTLSNSTTAGAVNTGTASPDLIFYVTLADGAETVTLESYCIEVMYAA